MTQRVPLLLFIKASQDTVPKNLQNASWTMPSFFVCTKSHANLQYALYLSSATIISPTSHEEAWTKHPVSMFPILSPCFPLFSDSVFLVSDPRDCCYVSDIPYEAESLYHIELMDQELRATRMWAGLAKGRGKKKSLNWTVKCLFLNSSKWGEKYCMAYCVALVNTKGESIWKKTLLNFS